MLLRTILTGLMLAGCDAYPDELESAYDAPLLRPERLCRLRETNGDAVGMHLTDVLDLMGAPQWQARWAGHSRLDYRFCLSADGRCAEHPTVSLRFDRRVMCHADSGHPVTEPLWLAEIAAEHMPTLDCAGTEQPDDGYLRASDVVACAEAE